MNLDRRRLIAGSTGLVGSLALSGCATGSGPWAAAKPASPKPPRLHLEPIRASWDRVFDITVCTRPFRAAGPRLEVETLGDKRVVHNYGHGGSGWSLSWGSAQIAVENAMAGGTQEIAVIGCGAIGLTSAIMGQEAGAKVTIYAKDLLPDTRSARATGSWTPDSRIALRGSVSPEFPALWERMARYSFHRYRRYLGLPGDPVEFLDQYYLSDEAPGAASTGRDAGTLPFVGYADRLYDLVPHSETLEPGATDFPTRSVRRASRLIFNVADYAHTLMADFRAAGGRVERREFHTPADLAALKEAVIINCPGYGARALWKDDSVAPVRGQIGWLMPQPEARYGLYYKGVSALSRRDGIVVQALWGGDMMGYGEEREVIDRAETDRAIRILQDLNARMTGAPVIGL